MMRWLSRPRSAFSLVEILVASAVMVGCFVPVLVFCRQGVVETSVIQEDLLAHKILMDMCERFKTSTPDELQKFVDDPELLLKDELLMPLNNWRAARRDRPRRGVPHRGPMHMFHRSLSLEENFGGEEGIHKIIFEVSWEGRQRGHRSLTLARLIHYHPDESPAPAAVSTASTDDPAFNGIRPPTPEAPQGPGPVAGVPQRPPADRPPTARLPARDRPTTTPRPPSTARPPASNDRPTTRPPTSNDRPRSRPETTTRPPPRPVERPTRPPTDNTVRPRDPPRTDRPSTRPGPRPEPVRRPTSRPNQTPIQTQGPIQRQS
jgi:hypothetical protein